MRRETVRNSVIVLLVIIVSFAFFYHGADQVLRLGLTHTLIISGDEGTADFTAGSDLPIYISGYNTFDIVGEEVDFTVTLYDDQGIYLAHIDVFLDSPGLTVETLSYHETLDYAVTPGEQYSIEIVGRGFSGVVEQPHTILAEFFLHWFYMGEVVGLIYLFIAILWFLIIGVLFIAAIVTVKNRITSHAA
jgi:hypothetical protein